MERHHLLVLVVTGVVIVLAVMLLVGHLNGGDAGDEQDQPTSELVRLTLR
jgi:hypothetical protein